MHRIILELRPLSCELRPVSCELRPVGASEGRQVSATKAGGANG